MFSFRSLREFDETEGTVTLVDTAHRLKHRGDLVLIPQPSDDVNDPLNWPQGKKIRAFIPVVIFSFLGNWCVAGLAIALLLLVEDFGRDLNTTAQAFIEFPTLALGLGNFFWTPTALYIGKRPTFLLASALFFATIIWSAKATSYGGLLASHVLSLFAAAASESLSAAINADLFFLHERGSWMGVYSFVLQAGGPIGSIASGFAIQALGWRWHLWLCGIGAGLNLVAMFLFLPETQYFRAYDTGAAQPEYEKGTKTSDSEVNPESAGEPYSTKKTFMQELKPWTKINPNANYFNLLFRPWPLIVYPAIFFSFISFSTTLAWIVCYADTAASVYQSPPYLMNVGVSTLYNIPGLIGAVIGSYCGGALTDLIVEKLSRKNNGVFEPEYRLVVLVFPFFLVPVGLLMYGIGVQHTTHWSVPFIGEGFLYFGLVSVPSITMTYVIDSYYPVAFEAMVLICGLKNVFAFGFSYGIVPWIIRSGYQAAFGEMVAIQCGVMLLAIPLWFYGKQLRHISAGWKVISW